MKKVTLILSTVVITAMELSSCGGGSSIEEIATNEEVVSNEESPSKEVTIGKQVWMTENLNVAYFQNGDEIPEVKTDEEWEKAGENKQPAWCYYDNDPANGAKYGKLYNWYAVNDSRGLAPVGYHIPSDAEWTELEDFLGTDAGKKMKSTSGWNEDGNGTNESSFSGLPGGYRFDDGSFGSIGGNGYWWSSSENATNYYYAWNRGLKYSFGNVYRDYNLKEKGFSVRCIKGDKEITNDKIEDNISSDDNYIQCDETKNIPWNENLYYGSITDVDGNKYKTVKIGNQEWMAENLKTTHYSNNDPIPLIFNDREWRNTTSGAICWYVEKNNQGDTVSYENCYGGLYNGYVIADSRNVCPTGWHVPSTKEWQELLIVNDRNRIRPRCSPLLAKYGWHRRVDGRDRQINGIDMYGFRAIPTSFRFEGGHFFSKSTSTTYFWCSNSHYLSLSDLGYEFENMKVNYGYNIRCIKDNWVSNEIQYGSVKDIDGNKYKTVIIGNQEWIAENLNVERFCNGDLIKHAKTNEEWIEAENNSEPAWCYYKNESSNGNKYGKLYNFYAVYDSRGLAPEGFHIPNESEFKELFTFLGDEASTKIKPIEYWFFETNSYKDIAPNESGFTAIPGGCRNENGLFSSFAYLQKVPSNAYWWTSTYLYGDKAKYFSASGYGYTYRGNGFSVRCLRD